MKNNVIQTPPFIRNLFPFSKKVRYEKLKMTKIGLYSISNRHDSGTLTRILGQIVEKWGLNPKTVSIADGTAGIGGNAISFGLIFGDVHAIEIDNIQYEALENNVKQYGLTNLKTWQGDCLKLIPNLDPNIVFIDPPWGGKSYKNETDLDLMLQSIPLVHIINIWKNVCKNLSIVTIKIPKNFSLYKFANSCDFPFIYLLYFRKYNVLVLSKRVCKTIEHRQFLNYVKTRRNSI